MKYNQSIYTMTQPVQISTQVSPFLNDSIACSRCNSDRSACITSTFIPSNSNSLYNAFDLELNNSYYHTKAIHVLHLHPTTSLYFVKI